MSLLLFYFYESCSTLPKVSTIESLLRVLHEFGQISEEMDIRTRRALLSAMVGKVGKRMDTLLIPLELLCCISRTEFSDKKSYIKWQKRQVSSSSLLSFAYKMQFLLPPFLILIQFTVSPVKYVGGRACKPSCCGIWRIWQKSE